ncbi:MAG: polysaccharide pyruvyl transferase family protein [bacterium]
MNKKGFDMFKSRGVLVSFFVLFGCSVISGKSNFGYINHGKSRNIGDAIQSIAAKRFIPKNSIGVEREALHRVNFKTKINTIMNAWYGGKSWPPSDCIEPLLISMHFNEKFFSVAFSHKGIAYLKQHGPVGTRDYSTFKELQKRGIPSYYSGCLTLTLENPYSERDRNDIIYAVDIDAECIKFIKSKTKYKVEVLSHRFSKEELKFDEEKFQFAEEILKKYSKAKCVITSRLHAAMPCLALKTPVLLINIQKDQYRFEGLNELVRNCSREELLAGLSGFDLNEPTQNSDLYVPIRENLIKIVTNWVESKLK